MNTIYDSKEPPDFSLVRGGPLFQLLVRCRLCTPALGLLKRRIIFFSLLAWLPLLLLALIDGKAWGGVGIPFLHDIAMHVRFLVALPLLIIAELHVHNRLRMIVGQFIARDAIKEEEIPRFKSITGSAMKLLNSVAMELILLALVFVVGNYFWITINNMKQIESAAGSWYSTADAGARISPAGYWYAFVSRPLFQFMLLRWYFRMFIWGRFLWQSSRLNLNLVPTHPDRAAGLGFLGGSSAAFSLLLLAHGAMFAGMVANLIFFAGARLTDFKITFLGGMVFLLSIVLGPLLFFSPQLIRAKRAGLREYGILAGRYATEFDRKWVNRGAPNDEPLLGTSDIQSLADMGNSYQVIKEIRPFPFSKDAVIQIVCIPILPILPLLLTLISLEELLLKLLSAVI